jgi:hypothetical protein
MLWRRYNVKNVDEKSSLDVSVEGKLAMGPDGLTGDTISTRDLIEPIFTKAAFISLIAALLFSYLGSSNILVSFDAQSKWLVSVLAWIWPVLPIQYELVRQVQGVGQSVSYAFLCTALWAWPLLYAGACLRKHVRCQKEILPISRKEKVQFFIVFPWGFFFLVYDVTSLAGPFGFPVNHSILLYLRQWFVFGVTAIVLGILLYVLGRILLERIWRRSD